jgi:hypothetical protein
MIRLEVASLPPSSKSDGKVVETVLVGGVPCRLIEFADGSGKVESFVNGAWGPAVCTLKEFAMGTPADAGAPAGGAVPSATDATPETGPLPVTPMAEGPSPAIPAPAPVGGPTSTDTGGTPA